MNGIPSENREIPTDALWLPYTPAHNLVTASPNTAAARRERLEAHTAVRNAARSAQHARRQLHAAAERLAGLPDPGPEPITLRHLAIAVAAGAVAAGIGGAGALFAQTGSWPLAIAVPVAACIAASLTALSGAPRVWGLGLVLSVVVLWGDAPNGLILFVGSALALGAGMTRQANADRWQEAGRLRAEAAETLRLLSEAAGRGV